MLGGLIGAGASIIGGILGNKAASDASDQQWKRQKKVLQQGIQWRVQDAKKAGIHPVYALGTPPLSYSPTAVGDPGGTLAQSIGSAGQDIGRAIDAYSSHGERVDGYTKAMQGLALQRAGLENDLLRSQIARTQQAGSQPAIPTVQPERQLLEGQGDTRLTPPPGSMKITPNELTGGYPGARNVEVGVSTDTALQGTSGGRVAPVPSYDAAQRMQDDFIGMLAWNVRNRLLPTFGYNQANVPVPDGKVLYYNPLTNEYSAVDKGGWYDPNGWANYRLYKPGEGYRKGRR